MSDRAAMSLALATAVGAWLAVGVPMAVAVAAVATALLLRRPWVLCLAVAVLASCLSARSWAGLGPAEAAPWNGPVTLVSDPEEAWGALRVDVRAGGRRLEAWARGPAANALRPRLAGEGVDLVGRVGPPPPDAPWLARRHVAGRLSVQEVVGWRRGSVVTTVANGLRRTLLHGAESLSPTRRSLFAGVVLGDDRDQPPEVADDFRAAGLTHLLAVSGQNVAFVLALAAPLLSRLGFRGRFLATVAVLGFFAMVTRFEPSVLRASAMAGIAAAAASLGREASSRRLLALAVTALLLIDPLLVGSVGFLLSVAASAGIILLAPALAAALPGPRPFATAAAVTVAAQVGVAPVLVPVFGGLPVASLPANLVAVPAAGPVMVWGLTGGVVAGIVGGPVASLLHLPTWLLVGWLEQVARRAAALPLGELQLGHVGALALTGAVAVAARRRSRRGVSRLAGALAVGLLLLPAWALRRAPPVVTRPLAGVALWRVSHDGAGPLGGTVLVLDGPVSSSRLLEELRRRGLGRIDVVVASSGGAADAEAVAILGRRVPPRLVLAPPGHRVPGATVPATGAIVGVGGLEIAVTDNRPRLEVAVTPVASPRGPGARSPPLRREHPGRGDGHPQPHARLVLRPGRLLGL